MTGLGGIVWRAALLLVVATAARAQGETRAVHSSEQLSLEPGDVLRVAVWRRPEFSGEFVVGYDSSLTHPLLRELKVVGIPMATVEERVRTFLTRYDATPAFVISPMLRVFVGGEVRVPNVYSVPPGTTVSQAVALAGGVTERGRTSDVQLVGHGATRVVDILSPELDSQTIVRSGDQVSVGRSVSFLRDVLGPSSAVFAALAAVVTIIRR